MTKTKVVPFYLGHGVVTQTRYSRFNYTTIRPSVRDPLVSFIGPFIHDILPVINLSRRWESNVILTSTFELQVFVDDT